jgi:hypothetical protein
MKEITPEEIEEVIRNSPNNKAPGREKSTYEWYKHIGKNTTNCLVNLFNICIKTSEVPRAWRKSNIIPIPKKENWDNDFNNLRPIALLETPRKLFTKILTNRLGNILRDSKILAHNNWAGLPGENTEHPIIIMENIIEEAREQNKECWILFQDMRKAFDSVSKEELIRALRRIGTPLAFNKMIDNLCTDRTGRVLINGEFSEEFEVQEGIDQGDSLSPLLWINENRGKYEIEVQ